jgi:hypothetical protein
MILPGYLNLWPSSCSSFSLVSTYRSYVPIQASGGEVIRHLIVVGVFASVTAFQHCPISLVTSVVFILSGKRITVPLLSLGLDPDIKYENNGIIITFYNGKVINFHKFWQL